MFAPPSGRPDLDRNYEQATQPEAALQKRTALLCFCREADTCHRSLLIAELFPDFTRLDLEPALF